MFGRSVAALRRRAGLTQEELAARTGISVRGIRDIEAGRVARPRPITARLLAEAFGLTGAARDRFAEAAAAVPVPAGPSQLPMDVPAFTGRVAELSELDDVLDTGRAGVVVVFAVGGAAGVGKTALALHWAHRAADHFPDGQLYANLRGFDAAESVVDPADALRGFLEALEVPVVRIPSGLDARAGMFRSLLRTRRMLVVLDNARDEAQVRPLLPGGGRCVAVVTSRDRMAGLVAVEGARPIRLDVLSGPEANDLLAGRLGADRLAAEPAAAAEIIEATARLPLALAIVAARVAGNPSFPLAAVADELRPEHGRLAPLADVFSWSYLALPKPAARLFRLLGLHPGPDLTGSAAAALAEVPPSAVTPLLADLTRLHLLTEHVPGRYTFHDLLRAYAGDLVSADTDDVRQTARGCLLDHYLHAAMAAAVLLQPQWVPLTPMPRIGPPPLPVTGHDQALAWFAAELRPLIGAVRMAVEHGFDAYAWQLGWALATYLAPQGLWPDNRTVQTMALKAADRSGDPAGRAVANRLLARADTRLGRLDHAERRMETAVRLYRELDDPGGEAQTLHNLAELYDMTARPQEALDAAGTAVELYRRAGNKDGEARTLNGLGYLSAKVGDYATALARCTEALAVQEARGDRNGQAATLDSLAYAYEKMGEPARAVQACARAVELFRSSADRYHEAESLVRLGDLRDTLGDRVAARSAWQAALDIFDVLGDTAAAGVRERLSGHPRPGSAGT